MINSISLLMLISAICLVVSGCSFSKSSKSLSKASKSISKSASSPSRWSGRSSHKEGYTAQTASKSYEEEVIALTELFVKSEGTSQDFQQELSHVSKNHGIVDWENNSITYESIGLGLKQSGISDQNIQNLPFLNTNNFFKHHNEIISAYNIPGDAS